jgi:hypothetical protein
MDHKNPVSGSGDGVLYLDIMKKPAKCTGCKYWQEYQKNVKHFFSLFFRQHSPCPDRTGFF